MLQWRNPFPPHYKHYIPETLPESSSMTNVTLVKSHLPSSYPSIILTSLFSSQTNVTLVNLNFFQNRATVMKEGAKKVERMELHQVGTEVQGTRTTTAGVVATVSEVSARDKTRTTLISPAKNLKLTFPMNT